MIALGKVDKMKIIACSEASCSESSEGDSYDFLVNPETYNHRYSIHEDRPEAPGGNVPPPRYFSHQPAEWEFEILIDGTGVIKEANALNFQLLGSVKVVDVEKELTKLRTLCVDQNGEIHRNNFMKVMWGDRSVFKGSLASLDLNYKLFDSHGTPLRVIAKLKLIESFSDSGESAANPFSSPDITHQRIFRAHDRFALLTNSIYNDPKYYFDVAQINSMDSFRKVKPGLIINFPPVK